ncbi:hypothetical protein Ahy_A08g038311 [Arachis hypogaea]|uniref:Uncharacterized protein n=1 Tax=Arachis hypogaea TaxID=3818 RepID=A0A445BTE6_ARAHY|nr:hypothetical protein Ahy_A08g038311 [Arachis hypogaea]
MIHLNHLQWRTLAALNHSPPVTILRPLVSPIAILSPSNPPISIVAWFLPSSPPSPSSLSSQHQHAVALSSRGPQQSTPVALHRPQVIMEDSINQEATTDNNASVNNNMPAETPIPNDAANPNSRSANDSQSQGSSNLRGKTDLAWKYVALQMVFNGDGIHRMKKYLAEITGDVKKCHKVPYNVKKQMESLLKDIQTSKKKRKVSFGEEGGDEVEDAIDEAIAQEEQEQQRTSSKIDADLYQSGGGSNGLYAASLDSSVDQGGNEGEDHPIEADLQQILANFDD